MTALRFRQAHLLTKGRENPCITDRRIGKEAKNNVSADLGDRDAVGRGFITRRDGESAGLSYYPVEGAVVDNT